MKLFGREPALWIGLIGAVLTWAAGLGIDWLSAGQATAITMAITGGMIALYTRPIAPGLFVAALGAVGSMLAEYGLNWSDANQTALAGILLAGFALFGIRPQVTPAADLSPTALGTGKIR